MKKSIILIGMPGCGKSTLGVLLAKRLGLDFLDTDIVIQNRTGELLYETLEKKGVSGLLEEERLAILSLDMSTPRVIATGGSAVLREDSMVYLKQNGICVYIYAPYTEINKRVNNRGTRGIAAENNETLLDIYNYRTPFYRKYADITVECTGFSAEKNADRIAAALEQKGFE